MIRNGVSISNDELNRVCDASIVKHSAASFAFRLKYFKESALNILMTRAREVATMRVESFLDTKK